MIERANCLVTIEPNPDAPPLGLRLVVGTLHRGGFGSLRVVGEHGAGGYIYSLASGSLPTGMGAINAVTGIASGPLSTAGRFEFVARVQDSSSTVRDARFVVVVHSALEPASVTPPAGQIGVPYNFGFIVDGGVGPLVWTKLSGDLPPGLTLSSGGRLSGTPTTPHGTSYAMLRVTDPLAGDSLDIAIAVTIAAALEPVDTLPRVELVAGVIANVDIEPFWNGGTPPFRVEEITNLAGYALKYAKTSKFGHWGLVGKPPMVNYEESTSAFPVQFRVTDRFGVQASIPFALTIINPASGLGTKRGGVVVGRGSVNIDFQGTAVSSVTTSDEETVVVIDKGVGTVTSVTATAPLSSTGGATPNVGHNNSGVMANTYAVAKITVNATGHVTGAADATAIANTWSAPQTFLSAPTAPSYSVGGTKVVGTRDTGWGAVTGLGIAKTAWTVYTTPGMIANTYSATVAGQLTTALAALDTLSKRVAALQQALDAHGLIGS